jgi:hypothetical protein
MAKKFPQANGDSRYELLLMVLLEPLMETGMMHEERAEAIYNDCASRFHSHPDHAAILNEVIIPKLERIIHLE